MYFQEVQERCIPVSSTGKVSDGCIRDLGFNPCLNNKNINTTNKMITKKSMNNKIFIANGSGI